ncbi:MAG: hypothetical protein DMD35_07965 [Gemmatimonadetes bacterium]|nr:MAG: hypothetical protein DMD35_07965 [Gemmatimonadota bacterium]
MGPDGGTLAIVEAGVNVTLPRGALTSTTTITMTARAGSLVAYDFAPHGVVLAAERRERDLDREQAARGSRRCGS